MFVQYFKYDTTNSFIHNIYNSFGILRSFILSKSLELYHRTKYLSFPFTVIILVVAVAVIRQTNEVV